MLTIIHFLTDSGIEGWQTIKKNRYENHLGHLNVRSTEMLMSHIQPSHQLHSSQISVCSSDLDDEEKMILDWSRNNKKFATEMEYDLKHRFEQMVNSLDVYVEPEHVERASQSKMYNLGSQRSMNMSVLSLGLKRFDSHSTITEVQSTAQIEKTETPRALQRLSERLKAASISTNSNAEPNKKTEAKRIAYVPSGFERDILEFHKFNQI